MNKTSKFHSKHHNQKWYYELTLIFAKYAFNSFSDSSYVCFAIQNFLIPSWRFCSNSSYTYRWNYEKKLYHRTCFDSLRLLFGGNLHLLLQENSTRSQEEKKLILQHSAKHTCRSNFSERLISFNCYVHLFMYCYFVFVICSRVYFNIFQVICFLEIHLYLVKQNLI